MKLLAAIAGLHNGFLAPGLLWGVAADETQSRAILTLFLACVALAEVVGIATTGNRRAAAVQTTPAAVELALLQAP